MANPSPLPKREQKPWFLDYEHEKTMIPLAKRCKLSHDDDKKPEEAEGEFELDDYTKFMFQFAYEPESEEAYLTVMRFLKKNQKSITYRNCRGFSILGEGLLFSTLLPLFVRLRDKSVDDVIADPDIKSILTDMLLDARLFGFSGPLLDELNHKWKLEQARAESTGS